MPVIGPSQRHLRRMVNGRLTDEVNAPEEQPTIKERVVSQEEFNMKTKQVPIMDAINHYIYTDKYGVALLSFQGVWLKDATGQPLNSNQVFKKEGKNFVPVNNGIQDYIAKEDWGKVKLYVRDPSKKNNNPYGYYGYNNGLVAGQEKEVELSGITIRIGLGYYIGQNNQTQVNEDLSFSSKKELDSYMVLVFDSFSFSDLKRPLVSDIKDGGGYYLLSKGTVKVVQLYPYPQRKNRICKVADINGSEYEIDSSCRDFFFLPTVKWNNPLKTLDENNDEVALSPYLIREGKTFNVYWKSIEDAAEYIVSLYRIIELDGRIDLYHLKDYVVDRNDNFLTVDGLIGNTFVFKVSAENRNGEVIAKSRGIKNGIPEFFTREDE